MPRTVSPGFLRTTLSIFSTDPAIWTGTGAITVIDSLVPGFRCWLERLSFSVITPGAGAGATQTFSLRVGGVTGTSVIGIAFPLTGVDTAGEQYPATPSTIAAANAHLAYLGDTDGFSLTRAAGGTAFTTAPTGVWQVTLLQQPQVRRSS
jgi:hypothetical protein